MRKRKFQVAGSNAIYGAATSACWGKRNKPYKGIAGKGGKTTNYEIPEWMFDRELKDMEEGEQSA